MDLGLRGDVAVITGASVGIGLAVAEGLAAEGAHIVMAARQGDRLTKEAKRIAKKYGVKTLAVACDVATDKGAAKLIAATKKQFKGADILINNAGTGSNETIMEATDDKWQYYWDLHVMAAVRLARGFTSPELREAALFGEKGGRRVGTFPGMNPAALAVTLFPWGSTRREHPSSPRMALWRGSNTLGAFRSRRISLHRFDEDPRDRVPWLR